jgi:AcrR family transcriptional regulator
MTSNSTRTRAIPPSTFTHRGGPGYAESDMFRPCDIFLHRVNYAPLYTMSTARRPRPSTGTRETILEAAWRLLESDGAAVRLEQVAAAAGVSRQAVYIHFQSRNKLLLALMAHISESQRMPERLRQAMAASSAEAALDSLVEVQTDHNARIAAAAAALDSARRTDPAAAEAWNDRMKVRRQGARKFVERLAAEGRLRRGLAVEEATDIVWALLSVRLWEDLIVGGGWPRKRFLRRMQQLVRRAVVAPRRERAPSDR